MRLLLTCLTAALGFIASSASSADITLRIGSAVPEGTAQGRAWERIAKSLQEKKTGINIRMFHSGQLGAPEVQVQNVRIGAQDGFVESPTWWQPLSDALGFESAPFLFSGPEHLAKWYKSDYFNKLQQDLIAKGNQRLIVPDVTWWRGPFRVLMANKPILTLDDVSKAKFRMPAIEMLTRYWGKEGLGGNIVNIAWNDVYLALRQNVADAVTSPFDLVVSMRFAEVAPHVMLIDEFRQTLVLGINEDKWKQLSEDQRKALVEAMNESGREYNKEIDASVQKWMDDLKKAGATIHEVDRRPFLEKVKQLNQQYAAQGKISKEALAVIESLR
jgi:TRAP-type transport system periplasmic protein